MASADSQLARRLRELISALDRRVPHVERSGETSIARDAASLRAKAMRRLEELADQKTSAVTRATDRSSRGARGKPE